MRERSPASPVSIFAALAASALSLLQCGPLDTSSVDEGLAADESALESEDGVSFLVTSDVHFGHGAAGAGTTADSEDDAEEEAEERANDRASTLTNLQKNEALEKAIEVVLSPSSEAALRARRLRRDFRALVITGDLTDDGQPEEWRSFLDTYPRKLATVGLPVYETAGNHDYPHAATLKPFTLPSDVHVISQIAARNTAARRPGLVAKSGGGAYAWKVDDVLFVNLGVKASNESGSFAEHQGNYRSTNPFESLRFLRTVLAKHGRSAASIVLAFHYPIVTGKERMTQAERLALYDAIKGYPVKAIVHGHRHRSDTYAWCGVPVFEVDTPRFMLPGYDSSMVAVRVTGHHLNAQTIQFRRDSATSDVEVGFDPAACRLKKDASYCWSFRTKLSAIAVEPACDVGKVVSLR